MTNTSSSKKEKIELLKNRISRGELTFGEINRRLRWAIDNELSKGWEEIDLEFIDALTSFYSALNNIPEYVVDEQKREKHRQEFCEYIKYFDMRKARRKRTITIIFAIACTIILVFSYAILCQ